MTPRGQLGAGARALGLELTGEQCERLLRLAAELARWNRAYNLTAITEPSRIVTHHLLDSLSVHGDLQGARIADVGTGAGFPGLPLAIVHPQRAFTLIDSAGKKTRFVAHAVRLLELKNVTAVHARAEQLRPERPFDTVVARAFAPLPQLLEKVRGLCADHTRVLAMKGDPPRQELEAIGAEWRIAGQRRLTVPGVGESRHLVTLELS